MKSESKSFNYLLADDGSDHAQAAIRLLSDLPNHQESFIHVISILHERQLPERGKYDDILSQTQNYLKNEGYKVDIDLLFGHPAETIVNLANDQQPDLIVMGAVGLRATLGILLGGVAQQVVEYSNHPVLVVRAPYRGLNKVLFVTDGSERSQKTLNYLCQFPLPHATQIQVMHVMPPLPSPDLITRTWPMGTEAIPPLPPVTLTEEFEKWEAEETQQGQKLLEQTVDTLKSAGINATSLLKRGDAATEIIDYVKLDQIDLIITGSRGVSQIQGWLLGSVSRKLIHYAGCSILLVK
jgi:nucleotide-binding universal stress UspA family protein